MVNDKLSSAMPQQKDLAEFNKGVEGAKKEYENHPISGYNTAGRSRTTQGMKDAPTYDDLKVWIKDLRDQLREVTAERNQARYELGLLRNNGKPALRRGQW